MSAYLTVGVEDDTTFYSLFHDALRGTLRERWATSFKLRPPPAQLIMPEYRTRLGRVPCTTGDGLRDLGAKTAVADPRDTA